MMGDALMTDDDWLGVHNLLWSVPRRCAACLLQVLADPLLRRSRRPLAFSHGPRVTGGVVFACWQMGTPCGGDVGLSVPGGRRARPVRTIMLVSCDREPAGRPRVAWRDGNKLRARGRRVTSLTLFVCMRAVASDQTSPLRVGTLLRRSDRTATTGGGPRRAPCVVRASEYLCTLCTLPLYSM
jgi:hypothetical protein